jgi:hypothetical protein
MRFIVIVFVKRIEFSHGELTSFPR